VKNSKPQSATLKPTSGQLKEIIIDDPDRGR
jgi:hypothetical protein